MATVLETEALTFSYSIGWFRKPIDALKGVDLTVEEGDFFSILGPNGAGKSTAFYCCLGLLNPKSGSVRLMGKKPSPGSPLFEDVAYLPEEPHYHSYLTIDEALTYYGSLHRRSPSKKEVDDILERFDLAAFRKNRLTTLSKGMKQKFGIATCILSHPKIIFMDEPTRGLDPIIVREIRQTLAEINQQGTTIIVNSHVLAEVERVASKVAIIDKGKLLTTSSLDKMLAVDDTRYQVTFYGKAPEEGQTEWPYGFVETRKRKNSITGVIEAGALHQFLSFLVESNYILHSAQIVKKTLDEAFFETIKEASDAG